MRKLFIFLFVLITFYLSAQTKGTFIDNRDNKTYKTITIGSQTWMAENLNYKANKYWYYNNDSVNSKGLLYDYKTILNGNKPDTGEFQGICPSGWHIPTVDEWTKLLNFVGKSFAAEKLRSVKFKGGDNFGFNSLPNGRYIVVTTDRKGNDVGSFENGNTHSYYWSITERDEFTIWAYFLFNGGPSVSKIDGDKRNGLSIRCVKDK
jgi:uncharacterized protein (TIGR02145 family)